MAWLINAAQLDKFRKNQKAVMILDATTHLVTEGRDAYQEFLDKHIIDAFYFDIKQFDLTQDEKTISEKISALGVRNDYKIIFYDNSDLHSACRALWLFKYFGHNPHQLYILDGGLKAWEKYEGKLKTGPSITSTKSYTVKFQPQLLRTLEQMKINLTQPREQVVDVRHPVRYAGGPDPRPHVRPGYLPGSFCFPYMIMFNKETNAFLPLEKIRKLLTDLGVDFNSPIITMCGSGITAASLSFILDLLGHENHFLYNGSWAEWGSENLYPGENSLAERPVLTCLD